MAHNVSHFSIHADDLPRARRFYEKVFGWRFTPWGPPDFFLIQTGPDSDKGIHGALQKRDAPLAGKGVRGYECTITVENVDPIAEAIVKHGGKIVTPKMVIPTVGTLVQFEDTEGNLACAMRYEDPAA
jgi:predicted enzyme related to lactoylglutathione lyase